MKTALDILKSYWGHLAFRPTQEAIIDAVLAKKDVIALLPTGGGKSLCYQLPPLLMDGICIVVSPLVALMEDQVQHLNQMGIKAIALKGGMTQDRMIEQFDNLRYGNYTFLYLSPERLQSNFIQEKIKQLNVGLIAIDEAHCISEWGHDFRPSYQKVRLLRDLLPGTPCMALTATATPKVLQDITKQLQLQKAALFQRSFERAQLAYQLFPMEDKLGKLIQLFTKTNAPAIVYLGSRKKTQDIARFLNAQGFAASYYHGGLSPLEKQAAYERWMSEKTPIMVATNAFGMGIDKDNVRVVVHLQLPNSIENYIQESGRAGRDGKKAYSVVFFNEQDILEIREKRNNAYPSIKQLKELYKQLHQYYRIAHGELSNEAFEFLFEDFAKRYQYPATLLHNALTLLKNHGIIQLTDSSFTASKLQFLVNSQRMLQLHGSQKTKRRLLEIILRGHEGLFEQAVSINEYQLAKRTGISLSKTISILEQWQEESLLRYRKSSHHAALTFLIPREDNTSINRIAKSVRSYITQKQEKTSQLLNFVENNQVCRSIQILNYFDELSPKACGLCDVCLQKKKNKVIDIRLQIKSLLGDKKPWGLPEICEALSYEAEDILLNLQQLMSEDEIACSDSNHYYIK